MAHNLQRRIDLLKAAEENGYQADRQLRVAAVQWERMRGMFKKAEWMAYCERNGLDPAHTFRDTLA